MCSPLLLLSTVECFTSDPLFPVSCNCPFSFSFNRFCFISLKKSCFDQALLRFLSCFPPQKLFDYHHCCGENNNNNLICFWWDRYNTSKRNQSCNLKHAIIHSKLLFSEWKSKHFNVFHCPIGVRSS